MSYAINSSMAGKGMGGERGHSDFGHMMKAGGERGKPDHAKGMKPENHNPMTPPDRGHGKKLGQNKDSDDFPGKMKGADKGGKGNDDHTHY